MFLGLASFVVWTQGGFQEQTGPLVLYAVNLALNLAWMPVSFPREHFIAFAISTCIYMAWCIADMADFHVQPA